KSFFDHVKYWSRFSPAPPWQLDDLQPATPTNWPPLSGVTSTSVPGLFGAEARKKAIGPSQHRTLRNTLSILPEIAMANHSKNSTRDELIPAMGKFFHNARRKGIFGLSPEMNRHAESR